MNKFIILLSLCMATCTSVFAQSDDEDDNEIVYISTGCKTSAANTYHSTRYCADIKLCRHEHDKSASKQCPEQCKHNGHVKAIDIDKAETMGKTPCSKCCKQLKKARKKVKKVEEVSYDD